MRILRVGVECDHAPYNWEENFKTQSNFPLVNEKEFYAEGYDVQIANLVAEKIGAKVQFKKVHFDDLLNALNKGEIDAIFSGMVDTYERQKIASFSIPYESRKTEYAVLINRRSKYLEAETLLDLYGARIVAQIGSRFDEVIDQIPNVVHFPPLESQSAVIDEILKFNVDGTVVNYDTGLSYEKTNPKYLKVIKFSEGNGFELGFTGLCAGVRKNDKTLLEEINNAIESISMRERQKIMDRTISKVWKNL